MPICGHSLAPKTEEFVQRREKARNCYGTVYQQMRQHCSALVNIMQVVGPFTLLLKANYLIQYSFYFYNG